MQRFESELSWVAFPEDPQFPVQVPGEFAGLSLTGWKLVTLGGNELKAMEVLSTKP